MDDDDDLDDDLDAPLFLVKKHCKRCKGLDLFPLRGRKNQGDGSSMTRYLCKSCGFRFVVVWEPPEPVPDYGMDR
jgi:DNA-directed RNA polymerase subunit M/transcription elongation factor TFIIS